MLTNTHLISFDVKGDERGSLIALEQDATYPSPSHVRTTSLILPPESGGDITPTRTCCKSQFASRALCSFLLDDGQHQEVVRLDSPAKGLFIGPMIWREMFDFTPDCVLLVLANKIYDPEDYIRDHETFVSMTKERS